MKTLRFKATLPSRFSAPTVTPRQRAQLVAIRARRLIKIHDPKWAVPRVRQATPLRHPTKLFNIRLAALLNPR